MIKELLTKLGQRETWLYAAGVGLSIFLVVAKELGTDVDPAQVALYSSVVTSLLGSGAYAHVKRGQQRGEEVAATAKKVWEGRKAPQTDGGDEEEGPWD